MRDIIFLGIPYHAGQPYKGVKLSPMVFRKLGLLRRLTECGEVRDIGDIQLPTGEDYVDNSYSNYLISEKIRRLYLHDSLLLNFGGDHGLALGTVHGMLYHHEDLIVVWADAHGDINEPETSPSGNFHGMPLAYLLGLAKDLDGFPWLENFLLPSKLIYFGPRALDAVEKEIIERLKIQYFSSEDMNNKEMNALLHEALKKADPRLNSPIHLSLDIDLFDPRDISSTGCLVTMGPKKEAIFEFGKILLKSERVVSIDIVELNPTIGSTLEMLRSFDLASDFLMNALNT